MLAPPTRSARTALARNSQPKTSSRMHAHHTYVHSQAGLTRS
jgi:hypothetical protein